MKSILRKAGLIARLVPANLSLLQEDKEKELLLKMAKYPELIVQAGQKHNPSDIAKYIFELTKVFNDYYHSINILKSNPKTKAARLSLVKQLSSLMLNAFAVLGLEALEEM